MFGGHIWELAIVLGLALIVFGPKRLPEIGGALGKGIREFKQSTSDLSEIGKSPEPATVPVSMPAIQPAVTPAHEVETQPASIPYSNAS